MYIYSIVLYDIICIEYIGKYRWSVSWPFYSFPVKWKPLSQVRERQRVKSLQHFQGNPWICRLPHGLGKHTPDPGWQMRIHGELLQITGGWQWWKGACPKLGLVWSPKTCEHCWKGTLCPKKLGSMSNLGCKKAMSKVYGRNMRPMQSCWWFVSPGKSGCWMMLAISWLHNHV